MEMTIFDEPIPFKGSRGYLQVGTYGDIPIYISKDVPRDFVALVGGSETKPVISMNDEVYRILPRKYLKTICERGITHGFDSYNEIPRTEDELEVLEFLKKYGIPSDLDRAAPSL